MYDFKKFKMYFIVLAFAVPLLLFTATGFGNNLTSVFKPADTKTSLAIERTERWEIKMRMLSRRH